MGIIQLTDDMPLQEILPTQNSNNNFLNADSTNLQTQVNSLASGSPLPAATASAMTNTSRMYVYVGSESGYTSGRLYYNNGSSWVDSGIQYQSNGIADYSVYGDNTGYTYGYILGHNKVKIDFQAKNVQILGATNVAVTNSTYYIVAQTLSFSGSVDGNKWQVYYDRSTKALAIGLKENTPASAIIVFEILESTGNDFAITYNLNPNCISEIVDTDGSVIYINDANTKDILSRLQLVEEKISGIEPFNPRPVIFDTDWGNDVDDVAAARVLLWAERAGMIDIVAVNHNSCNDTNSPSIEAYFEAEGRSGLVVSVDHGGPAVSAGAYQTDLMTLPHYYSAAADMEDAIHMYRRAFASAKQPLDIICVGFLLSISKFLQSPADDISSLTGLQLIKNNGGRMWCMGGKYPTSTSNEYNFSENGAAWIINATNYVLQNFPNEIIFCGYEAGSTVMTGGNLFTLFTPSTDVLCRCYNDYGVTSAGRPSWDPMTTLLAAYGDVNIAGYAIKYGTNSIDTSTGINTFTENTTGNHGYVVKLKSDEWYKNNINTILSKQAWPYRRIGGQQLQRL